MAASLIKGGLIQLLPCQLAPGINIEAELEELIAKSRVETEANSRSGSRKPSPTALPNARASKQDSPSLNLLPGLKGEKIVPCPLSAAECALAGEEYETSDDDACAHVPDVTAAFGDMTLDASISRRFHGKSSGMAPPFCLRMKLVTFNPILFQFRLDARTSC